MAKLNDLTGKTIGSWYVMYRNGQTANKAAVWHCRCTICGTENDVAGYSLTSGASTKCRSCVPKLTLSKPYRRTSLYNSYCAMMNRCNNPSSASYDDYGGRGITVCDEWNGSPDAFIEWALSTGYIEGLTIDRIDVDKGYSPSNCRWITLSEQARNKRTTIFINYNGETLCLSEACRKAGISLSAVRNRIAKHKVAPQEAFDHYLLSV